MLCNDDCCGEGGGLLKPLIDDGERIGVYSKGESKSSNPNSASFRDCESAFGVDSPKKGLGSLDGFASGVGR